MTAIAKAYDGPFISEVIKEVDGSFDDCAVASTLMLAYMATLGEIGIRPDGSPRDVITFREAARKVLGPDKASGGLRLDDMDRMLRELDPEYRLEWYPGQGGDLRLTWDRFVERIRSGEWVAVLNGNPVGIKDHASPLRTVQSNPDYGHAIFIGRGNAEGAIVKDPLQRKRPKYDGDRIPWADLRQFTEARKGGDRQFGEPDAIAVGMSRIGSETEAERAARAKGRALDRCREGLTAQKAQTTLALEERDDALARLKGAREQMFTLDAALATALADLVAATVALAECRAVDDCSAVQAELDAMTAGRDALDAALAEEQDRANAAEDVLLRIRTLVAP